MSSKNELQPIASLEVHDLCWKTPKSGIDFGVTRFEAVRNVSSIARCDEAPTYPKSMGLTAPE